MEEGSVHRQLPALCSLADPTRAALYEHVAERGKPVSRDEAAAAVGVARPVAAYHLDKLVEEGLLEPSFARPPEGRSGPGAGRPAKYYRASQAELEVSVPPRGYRLAARLLARAVSAAPTADVRRALERDARALGEALATDADATRRSGTCSGGSVTGLMATMRSSVCATARSARWPRSTPSSSAA